MKRWNWWLACRVLRGKIRIVSYDSRPRIVTVTLDLDADVQAHYDDLRPGR